MTSRPDSKWRRRILLVTGVTLVAIYVLYAAAFWFLRNPIVSAGDERQRPRADAVRLEQHVRALTAIAPSRNSGNLASMNAAADYISRSFGKTGCALRQQTYAVEGDEYRNVVCSFGPQGGDVVVLGAHYDVHGENNPGADDNASGVAGILEIARLVAAQSDALPRRLDLVAFALEERPAWLSPSMGSYVYARDLMQSGTGVSLMISVEMIGYYSDEPGSQHFPLPMLKLFYPDTATFIGVIGRAFDRSMVKRVKFLMSGGASVPVYSINAPRFVPGIDLSDHRNFWDLGLPAVMVTDTAFLRNPNYHRASDTADTLDYARMADVVAGLYGAAVDY